MHNSGLFVSIAPVAGLYWYERVCSVIFPGWLHKESGFKHTPGRILFL
jgi:hypothetical protein